jgi:hypothetical protein
MCLVPKSVVAPGAWLSPNEANGVRHGGFPERSQYQFRCVEFRNRCYPGRGPLPRTKPMGLVATSPIEANDRITKRSQWLSREDWSRKQARSPANRFRQTNPLILYDVFGSEKRRCSGGMAFPERSRGISVSLLQSRGSEGFHRSQRLLIPAAPEPSPLTLAGLWLPGDAAKLLRKRFGR